MKLVVAHAMKREDATRLRRGVGGDGGGVRKL